MTPTTPELRPDDFRPYALPDSLDTTIPTRRRRRTRHPLGRPRPHGRDLRAAAGPADQPRPTRPPEHRLHPRPDLPVLDRPVRRTTRRPHHRRTRRGQAGQPLGAARRQPAAWPRDQRPVPGHLAGLVAAERPPAAQPSADLPRPGHPTHAPLVRRQPGSPVASVVRRIRQWSAFCRRDRGSGCRGRSPAWRQWDARRSAHRRGASGDEPGTTRPGGTSLAALGRCAIPPARATPEPPPSLRDPTPAR